MSITVPTCKFLIRSKDEAIIYEVKKKHSSSTSGDKTPVESTILERCFAIPSVPNASMHTCSPDGTKVLFKVPGQGIVARYINDDDGDASTSTTAVAIKDNGQRQHDNVLINESQNVLQMTFSPLGTYLLTWERPGKSVGGEENEGGSSSASNMKVWNASTGEYLCGFHLKAIKRQEWPNIRWTSDEALAFHLITNELRIYKGNDVAPTKALAKVRYNGLVSFTLAPLHQTADASRDSNAKHVFSVFAPESKGKPAKISILRYPDRLGVENNSGPMISGKSFYQAEEITVKWAPKGEALLVLTHSSVDSSGESYYGSTNLYLLRCGGNLSGEQDACLSVPLVNDGPVVDVAWCPDSNKPLCFAVISGKMPAMASLHHGHSAEASFLFGNAHRNTIVWSPSGRFVCLAGFGNLAGGMDFWDRNKLKKMPQYDQISGQALYGNTAKSAACAFGWSPDSRMFHVSTTAPRMNVDNGIRLYKYNGLGPLCEFTSNLLPDKLLSAEFLPAKQAVAYPDRPQTPPPRSLKTDAGDDAERGLSIEKGPAPPTSATVQAYIPPSARNGVAGRGILAARLRAERERTLGDAKKVQKKSLVPGLSPTDGSVNGTTTSEQKSKSKSSIRREKLRLKKEQQEKEEAITATAKAEKEKELAATASEPSDPAKRAKKISKMLKQIEELKLKDPSTLNEDQVKKIGTKDALEDELSKLHL